MNQPLVSVIVTVHNREATVERALASVAAQTYRPLQIVAVDNASSDNSRAIVERWMTRELTRKNGHRVDCLLVDEMRQGACVARNAGLGHAGGEWIAFFDDDDEMSPCFIENMMQSLLSQPASCNRFSWVVARTLMVMPDGREVVRAGWKNPSICHHLLGNFISTQSFVVHRELLDHVGKWNESLPCWNDYALGAALLCASPHPVWNEGVYHRIYQHADSITGNSVGGKCEQIAAALCAVQETIDRDCSAPMRERARKALFFRSAIVAGLLLREGHRQLAARFLEQPFASGHRMSLWTRMCGVVLRHYVFWGGRGAWRLAILML